MNTHNSKNTLKSKKAAVSSFRKGYNQLQKKDVKDAKCQIMVALNLKSEVAFYQRLRGEVEPKRSEALLIEAVFKDYGIADVWGQE